MAALYSFGERQWRELEFFLQFVDEIDFPLQPLELPGTQAQGEDGDETEENHGRCDPSLATRTVGRRV